MYPQSDELKQNWCVLCDEKLATTQTNFEGFVVRCCNDCKEQN